LSSIVTETSERGYVGTAVTLQLAAGCTLTVVTIWLIPVVPRVLGWTWVDLGVCRPCSRAAARRPGHEQVVACPEDRLIASGRG